MAESATLVSGSGETIGEFKSGLNLKGICTDTTCIAAKAEIAIIINVGYTKELRMKKAYKHLCPRCKHVSVNVTSVSFYNAEYEVLRFEGAGGEYYSSADWTLRGRKHKEGVILECDRYTYIVKSKKLRQQASSLEDLVQRSEKAMDCEWMRTRITEMEQFGVTVVKAPLKGSARLKEKIDKEYNGDFNQVFDIGRFTILCEDEDQLKAALEVIRNAKFGTDVVLSKDKDCFSKGHMSMTHHRFHNIRLFVESCQVYIEMQATLKAFCTLKGHTHMERPKLSHTLYEMWRTWTPTNARRALLSTVDAVTTAKRLEIAKRKHFNEYAYSQMQLHQGTLQLIQNINDIICEWVKVPGVIVNKARKHKKALIPVPDSVKTEAHFGEIAEWAYQELSEWDPQKPKALAIFSAILAFYKKYVLRDDTGVATLDEAIAKLNMAMERECNEDVSVAQGLSLYVSLDGASTAVTNVEEFS